MVADNGSGLEKIVVHFGSRVLKGYMEAPVWNSPDELLSNAPSQPPQSFRIRCIGSEAIEEIAASDVKAVFYVYSFDGDAKRKSVNFHNRVPTAHGIWMRFQFVDGEVMEGIVFNSLRYLIDPGFFVLPTDPCSNNKLVYVVKSWLADHRVLGLRPIPIS